MEEHYYSVDINWKTGRKGIMCSPGLSSPEESLGCIEVATPPEFPNGVPGIWSPEHLFTASVASCFMTTFLAIAENSRLKFVNFICHAKGKLESKEGKMQMSEVHLFTEVTLANEGDKDRLAKVLQKTENACLISNSIKSKVLIDSKVNINSDKKVATQR